VIKRPHFTTVKAYGQTFTSVDYWRPYIEHVCSTERLGIVQSCVAGLAGTNPVFIVNDSLVLKFFTDLFGSDSHQVELAFYKDIQPKLQAPTPSLITHGELFNPADDKDWHCPYIVTTRTEGMSFGEVKLPTRESQIQAALFSARVLQAFHDTTLSTEGVLGALWTEFEKLLSERRNVIRSSIQKLPVPVQLRTDLLERLETITLPYDTTTTPKLLHGDLNRDHILGQICEGGRFDFTGVIDFGDVKVGDPLYDFVPLHLGLFGADKSLLRIFLDAYNDSARKSKDFAERAMNYTILYESDVLTELFEEHEEWRTISNLLDLQDSLWGI